MILPFSDGAYKGNCKASLTQPGAVGSVPGWSGRLKNVLHWLLPASSGIGAGGYSVLPSALRPNNFSPVRGARRW